MGFFTFCNYLLQFQVCLIILIAGHTSGYYGGYAGIDYRGNGSRDDVSDPEREDNGFIDNLDRFYQYQRFRYGKRSADTELGKEDNENPGFLADSFGGFGRYGGFGPKFVEDGGYGFVKRTSGNYGPVRYGKCKMVHN